jgi:hypothetical protein
VSSSLLQRGTLSFNYQLDILLERPYNALTITGVFGVNVKRIVFSIVLLMLVFVMSGFFAGEANHLSYQQNQWLVEHNNPSLGLPGSAECLCDFGASNPPLELLMMAAFIASLVMGTFIYGSHFIATWVAG